jgi:CHASE2 domain-containing sensor protein
MTYDLRARAALHFPAPAATNLAFVSMEESSITAVKNGKLGYHFGLYWPRQVYGRLIEELSAQGAKTVAFDVLFGELRHDHPPVQMADGSLMESDDFFALQMHRAGNVLLAVEPDLVPARFVFDQRFRSATFPKKIRYFAGKGFRRLVLRRVRAFDDQGHSGTWASCW